MTSLPSETTDARPNGNHVVGPGVDALVVRLAVEVLVLEEEHRVVAADRRPQEAVRVEGVRGHDDAQARDVRHEHGARLRVVDGAAADVAARRHADHDGRRERVAGAPAQVGELVVDLHVGRPDVVVELDLDDGLQPPHRHADRAPDDVGLRERRVEDARPCRRAAGGRPSA